MHGRTNKYAETNLSCTIVKQTFFHVCACTLVSVRACTSAHSYSLVAAFSVKADVPFDNSSRIC